MTQPVEYGLAADHYLAAARLGDGSRRVYRTALATWAWSLVNRTPPAGAARRRAVPPVLPLALLDTPGAAARLRAAFAERATAAGVRTANRELSILRSAVAWWRDQGWLAGDPTAGIPPLPLPEPDEADGPLDDEQVRAVLALRVPLREQLLWHLLYESGAPVERLLALDVDDLDVLRRRTRGPSTPIGAGPVGWRGGTARLLPLAVLSRTAGPLFLTDRRASARADAADVCPLSGRGRLSYRRAAEIFTTSTRPLDPGGRGWTLRRLRSAGRAGGRWTGRR
ncbi:hypothetical protein [Streptomyces meridianus]|uniref:Core-binding (CB) domain-containing protein n=1 Tax=Streptomyces meridianus TaxID=2938945 RepID=A0ABT0XC35_9ACTN|nr:hypothetical protein [Streptomyces meridianus]MCM2579364.1 hypothetical protein [Streptomyces meridianus]